jgi:deoxyribose-phosphate aldolase
VSTTPVPARNEENRVKSAAKPFLSPIRNEIDDGVARWGSRAPSDAEIASATSTVFIETLRAAKSGSLPGPELARLIDHTLLKADARRSDFEKLCAEARAHPFATVCVNTSALSFVAEALAGTHTLPIAVVGFPLGAMDSAAKAAETRRAVELGAREIDMVLPVGALKDGELEAVERDIQAVVSAAGAVPVKVILEIAYLTREEIIAACVIAKHAGAAFVKTSTGFAATSDAKPSGATPEAVSLMRVVVGPEMGVKASGGIRSREDALRMIAAGANRIGASASVAIATAGVAGAGNY